MKISKFIASWAGIGYIKGGGTIAAIVTCLLVYAMQQAGLLPYSWILALLTIIITLIGVITGNQVEKDWGKDSSRVVIDEVAGQMLTQLFIGITPLHLIIGLFLFRFFDILKPFYISRMENLPGGTGVMMDDIVAGVYANIILHVIALWL